MIEMEKKPSEFAAAEAASASSDLLFSRSYCSSPHNMMTDNSSFSGGLLLNSPQSRSYSLLEVIFQNEFLSSLAPPQPQVSCFGGGMNRWNSERNCSSLSPIKK
jgi:hypothetical protein